jgi:hypothetical protein
LPGDSIDKEQVGLQNDAITPPTNLSVTWYVNGNKVVETNNTSTTTLNPGFKSLFQLKQSIFVFLGQRPTETETYTLSTINKAQEFGSSLPFMLNQQTRCQDNILLTQKFRKFLKP